MVEFPKLKIVAITIAIFFFSIIGPYAVFAQACDLPSPSLTATSGPDANQVTLHWSVVPGADHYSLLYGLQSNKYIFGATNIGNGSITSFTVKSLRPGVMYFFRVGSVRGCSSLSNEASTMAKSKTRNVLGVSRMMSRRYVVKDGDTLSSIATKFGTTPMTLFRMNGIRNPNFITSGMILRVP